MKKYQTMIIALAALFVFGCGAPPTEKIVSPTETVKIFVEASKAKDAKSVQSVLSKGTLVLMESNAKKQNTTVEDLLTRNIGPQVNEVPEMRNELIEDETATVEVKSSPNDFEKIPFVKEEGVWKIALDKFITEALNKSR